MSSEIQKSITENHHSRRRVLIFTAALGGGHEAAGRAVRDELEGAGWEAEIIDGLRTLSPALDRLLVEAYATQARNSQESLGWTYALTARRTGASSVAFLVSFLFASRLLKVIQREQPDLVISTYPLVNSALGYLRSHDRLKVPAVAVIADYGAHPLWIAPGLDLHLVVSSRSAEFVERAGASSALVRMPATASFGNAPPREKARATLRLPEEAFVALIVGGELGMGNLEEATRCAAEAGAFAIVVTGKNGKLKAQLEAKFASERGVRVLGWRNDMPTLMSAADCLIQNAGGMTCIEAITVGLPILIFNPVPGHGELNANVMERSGTARWARTATDLKALLRSAAQREILLATPNVEPDALAVRDILESLVSGSPLTPEVRGQPLPAHT
ncbi:MAG TPA: glycosyltransferase [Rubrobacteraceae bacterium]|nr:glycosyltransferase [Rubrobacteraceae bacterium]